jgi:hypothetical protein
MTKQQSAEKNPGDAQTQPADLQLPQGESQGRDGGDDQDGVGDGFGIQQRGEEVHGVNPL